MLDSLSPKLVRVLEMEARTQVAPPLFPTGSDSSLSSELSDFQEPDLEDPKLRRASASPLDEANFLTAAVRREQTRHAALLKLHSKKGALIPGGSAAMMYLYLNICVQRK
mmetsp:Transcript_5488/g.11883  ORF Transcript_5488/g.11883 Transcript_5488/m.11883 type:complete len:110 (-) Transcript_5488:384-713(-)